MVKVSFDVSHTYQLIYKKSLLEQGIEVEKKKEGSKTVFHSDDYIDFLLKVGGKEFISESRTQVLSSKKENSKHSSNIETKIFVLYENTVLKIRIDGDDFFDSPDDIFIVNFVNKNSDELISTYDLKCNYRGNDVKLVFTYIGTNFAALSVTMHHAGAKLLINYFTAHRQE